MKIKTRLNLFNILIIALSSYLMLSAFGFIIYNLSSGFYNINAVTVDDNVDIVKSILENNDDYLEINNQINKYGYYLYVYQNKDLIYGTSNSTIEKLIDTSIFEDSLRTIFINNNTGVIRVENNIIYIAVQDQAKEEFLGIVNDKADTFISKFIVISAVSLFIVLCVAFLFSDIIIRKVMKPVTLLTKGAKRIKTGDFSKNIDYKSNDEFRIVVDSFNEMQHHLKEETDKNINYQMSRQEMINGISHDIRTPLTAVKGSIKGIKDGVANTKEKENIYLTTAYNRTLDIENLLNKLFDAFNYETGSIRLNKTRVDIEEFIRDFFNNRYDELKENKVNVFINKLSVKEYVDIDKIQFQRIFNNFLNNSIKYADVDKLIIDVNIWRENGNIKISYKDNGVGVDNSNLPYLFNEFYREDKSRNNISDGSGLGLFIVKYIVDAHNGNIIVENRNGLYFEIELKGENNE